MPSIKIELTEDDLKTLVYNHLQDLVGGVTLDKSQVVIEVKSKQNYKSEWEKAEFRAVYSNFKL